METYPKYSAHSDLPEASPEPDYSAYKFSVPESPHPHSTVHAVGTLSPPTAYSETEKPASRHGRWTRWPFLILYGLLLALIAGLIGGFVGKSMEHNKHKDAVSLESEACPTPTIATTPSSSSPPSPSLSATPTSSVFERIIPQPTSGCTSDAPFRSFKSRSLRINIPYTTICGQGWLRDDLGAMSVATQSDCIESCSTYNSHTEAGDRRCVGAGFIPEWWNQTRAMVESKITPYNCFLKTNTSGIARNNERFEVIALCMDGQCDGISG